MYAQVGNNEGEQSMEEESGGGEPSDENFMMFRNEVSGTILREFLGYRPKRVDANYVEGTIICVAWLDGGVARVVSCLVDSGRRCGQREKKVCGQVWEDG